MSDSRADIFHRESQDFGGRLDVDNLSPDVSIQFAPHTTHMNDIVNALHRCDMCADFYRNLYYDFLFNPEPNAVSWASERRYFIGINSGLVHLIHQVFFTLFSHPSFMPNVGNVNEEYPIPYNDLVNGFTIEQSLYYITPSEMFFKQFPVPKSYPRIEMALIMSQMALEFVFCHELGHILLGHLYFMASRTGKSVICESVPMKNKLALDSKSWQCLEYEADGFGIGLALRHSLMIYFGGQKNSSYPPEAFNAKELSYYCWFFAVSLLMRLFSQEGLSVTEYATNTHPHPQLRIAGNYFSINYSRTVNSDPERERIKDVCAKAAFDLSNFWRLFRIPGHKYDPNFDKALIDIAAQEINETAQRMHDLFRELEQILKQQPILDHIRGIEGNEYERTKQPLDGSAGVDNNNSAHEL